MPVLAVRALTAGSEAEHHVVALGQALDAGADRLHDAGALVAEHEGQRHLQPAGGHAEVGVADPRSAQGDPHLALAGIAQLHLLDGQGLAGLAQQGGGHFHLGDSSSRWARAKSEPRSWRDAATLTAPRGSKVESGNKPVRGGCAGARPRWSGNRSSCSAPLMPEPTPRPLDQCRAVIAGGTSGVGLAAARHLIDAGTPSVLLLGRDGDRGARAVASLPSGRADFLGVDAMDPDACASAVRHAVDTMGGIDVLVTAVASSEFPELLTRTAVGDVQRVVASHLLPPLHMTTAALPTLCAQPEGGSIVNVASDAGKLATPGESLIGAAMAGVIMFTRTVALEAKRSGVRANVLTPSLITGTPSGDALLESGFAAKLFAKAKTQADLGLTGPDDIAPLIVYLAGPDSAKVTGQAISVNGGISAA